MPKRYWTGIALLSLLLGCGNGSPSEKPEAGKLSQGRGEAEQKGAVLLPRASYPSIQAPSAPSSGRAFFPEWTCATSRIPVKEGCGSPTGRGRQGG